MPALIVIRPIVDSPAPGKRVKHGKQKHQNTFPPLYHWALQRNVEERANAANAQYNSTGDQRLAGATYFGNELPWLWQPKPKKCRKQLNGHLSSQTTIVNRLKSTFPPHLCKKIKFVPDSRQPFENGRILNLAVGLWATKTELAAPLHVTPTHWKVAITVKEATHTFPDFVIFENP